MKNYLSLCWTILVRPIYFFQKLERRDWKENSLNFLFQTSLLLSLLFSLVLFAVQFSQVLIPLFAGVSGAKFILILPVAAIMLLVFFFMLALLTALLIFILMFSAFCFLGILFYCLSVLVLGGSGKYADSLKIANYSAAATLFFIALILTLFLTKLQILTFSQFGVAWNVVFYLSLIYIYGIWSIGLKKVHNLPRWKAFAAAAVPAVLLILLNLVFVFRLMDKLEKFIA